MKAGELAEEALHQILKNNGSLEEGKEDSLVAKVLTLFVFHS